MKRLLCVWLILGLLVSLMPSALGMSGSIMYIRTLQSYNSRVKLREFPDTNSEILGQYYAGTEVFVLDYNAIFHGEVLDDWARVEIGGIVGYMMNDYLTFHTDESTPGDVVPLYGTKSILWDEKGRQIDELSSGRVRVLGTTENDTVHVEVQKNGFVEYGYLPAAEVLWTGEHQKARVRAIKSADSVTVYSAPNGAGSAVCSIYPGTEVQILFSNDVATSGWTRIRVDNVTGYLPDPYLDHSYGMFPFYRPQPATLKIPVAPVSGGTAKTISREDLMFVLGKRNTSQGLEYLVMFGAWEDGGSVYRVHTGYVPQRYIVLKTPGGVSTRGMLKKSSYLYQINARGQMTEITDEEGQPTLYPMGSEFQIAYGLDEALHREGGLLTGYLTEDTVWVFVELRVPEKYKGIQGYLPLKVIKYDKRLMLPGSMTGG